MFDEVNQDVTDKSNQAADEKGGFKPNSSPVEQSRDYKKIGGEIADYAATVIGFIACVGAANYLIISMMIVTGWGLVGTTLLLAGIAIGAGLIANYLFNNKLIGVFA